MKVKPHDYNLEILRKTKPEFRYDGAEDFALWQKKAREKLAELLGLPFEKCEDLFNIEFTKEHSTHTETRFTFQSEKGFFVPCHLLVPKNENQEKMPLVICLQGHSTGMHISLAEPRNDKEKEELIAEEAGIAIQAVNRGYCALTLEQRCFGESGGLPEPDCYKTSMLAIMLGRTLIGQRVWDVQRAIDVIESHFSFIDKDKICLMGNSGGGTATFYSACMEERISVAMPSCALCTFEKSIASIRHCSCNHIPNIAKYFDMGDLAGLIAPRKLVMVSGKEDKIFPIDGAQETYDLSSKMFKFAGAENNCAFVIGDGGHKFYSIAWESFDKLLNQ